MVVSGLAALAAAVPPRRPTGGGWWPGPGRHPGGTAALPTVPADLPWRLLVDRIKAGGPNPRLGLVQAQHIFGRVTSSQQLIRGGLVRVRIPASLIRLGDEGWRRDRFEDGWWMDIMRRLGVPFKAVVELWPRFTDEQHAAHAARLVQRANPDVVIIGNELNLVHRRPGIDWAAEIERYLNRYEAIHGAVRSASPATRIQLYGEAYDGDPSDQDAFLRHVLAAMRWRGLPPPDLAGIHIYDRASVIPQRVAGYRRLLADFGLHIPVSVEELGARRGVIDDLEARRLAEHPAEHGPAHGTASHRADQGRRGSPAGDARGPEAPGGYRNRLEELRALGWLTEDEHAELVAQQLATAAASADQAQIFCAIDFDAELAERRGLVSNIYDRARPALKSFRFLQRLLNDPAEVRLTPAAENGGVTSVEVVRRDGLGASIHWSTPVGDEALAPARSLAVPAYTFVCDAQGRLVEAPAPVARTIQLPAASSAEAGGAVRILI
jgi:hypothetical protein